MSEKHILIVDSDGQTLEEFRQALGQQWSVFGVGTGAAALEELKRQNYDGLVASLHLPDIDTAQLLNRVRSKYPNTVRFVVAAEKDRERVLKKVLGAHQFLIRPFTAEGLRTAVEQALARDLWVASDKLRKLVSRMRTLPTVPSLYFEILAALRSPDSSTQEVGTLLAKDMAIMTKLLQVINSAYFGLSRTITSAEEAVGILGFESVKSMVMAIKLLNQYDRIKTGDFSMERLWQHSTAVAHNARRLVLLQTGERALAEQAFEAGLLHDVGKAVLAGNFADEYRGVESLARKRQIAICEIEKEIFGANHAELGAYLLSLWGLPMEVLEATALHHQPAQATKKGFTPLTAVHVGNVLQYQVDAQAAEFRPKLDLEYLAGIGMIECLPAWCEEILGAEAAGGYIESAVPKPSASVPGQALTAAPPPTSTILPESAPDEEDSKTVTPLPEPNNAGQGAGADVHQLLADAEENAKDVESTAADEPVTDTLDSADAESSSTLDLGLPPVVGTNQGSRLFAGTTVAILILAVGWFMIGRHKEPPQRPIIVNAKQIKAVDTENSEHAPDPTANPGDASVAATPGQSLGETNNSTRDDRTPAVVAHAEAVSTNPTGAAGSQVQETKQLPVFPDLKLQGILFSPRKPSAIINGTLVHPNERLLGVRIVEIRSNTVLIEYQNQRRTLGLE